MYDLKADFKKGVIPNSVTLFGLLMLPPIIIFHREGMFLWSLFYFVIAWVCDWLDGKLARKYQLQSRLGEFFDPLADKIFTWSLLIYFWGRIEPLVAVAIMFFGFFATLGRVIIILANCNHPVDIDVMAGYAGKFKTNFEKSGLVLILLTNLIQSLGANIAGQDHLNYDVISKVTEFLSSLALALSLPLAFVSFLQIVLKLKRLWRST